MANPIQSDPSACNCKVGKARTEYHLTDLDDVLATQREAESASLRDLTELVNRSILAAAIEEETDGSLDAEMDVFGALDPEEAVESIYETLTDEDTSRDQLIRIESRLEQAGVDLAAVRNAWVTHPTVRTHLRECLGVDTSPDSNFTSADASQTIEWARSRCAAIVSRTIERLRNADQLTITDADVSLSIRITCTECQVTYRPSELFSRGRCGCATNDVDSDPGPQTD